MDARSATLAAWFLAVAVTARAQETPAPTTPSAPPAQAGGPTRPKLPATAAPPATPPPLVVPATAGPESVPSSAAAPPPVDAASGTPSAGAGRPSDGPAPAQPPGAASAATPEAPTPNAEPAKAADSSAEVAATERVSTDVETAELEEEELPWLAGLTWGHSYNAAGLTRGHEQTHNPTYAWSFGLSAGYRFDELTTLKLSQPLALELTDSDSTTTRQELLLLDTALELSRTLVETEPRADQSFTLSGSARLIFPTSIASRARTTVLGTRAQIGASYSFESVASGLGLSLTASYLHRFNRSNTVETDTSFPCLRAGSDVSESCTHLGSASVTRDLVLLALGVDVGLTEELTLGAEGSLGWNRGSSFEDVTIDTDTGPVNVADDSTTHFRNTRALSLSVSYAFTKWLSASAGVANEFSEIANGERRDPLQAVDTELTFELSVSFDKLYASAP